MVNDTVAVGTRVTINAPENPRLHGTAASVLEAAPWGALLDAPAAATGRFRALFSEMVVAGGNGHRPRPVATGDLCHACGGLMVRTGTCLTCTGCGESSGGCG